MFVIIQQQMSWCLNDVLSLSHPNDPQKKLKKKEKQNDYDRSIGLLCSIKLLFDG